MTHPLLPPHQDPILRMDLNLAPRQCLIHFGISTLLPVKRTPGSFESHVGDGQVHVVMRHSLPAAHTEQHTLSRAPVQNSTMTFSWRGLAPPPTSDPSLHPHLPYPPPLLPPLRLSGVASPAGTPGTQVLISPGILPFQSSLTAAPPLFPFACSPSPGT